MQGIFGAIIGAIIGAIFTFFFNRENEKKKNSYNLEKDYIEKVCVKIVQYFEENNKNDSLSREDIEHIVDFIEQVYKKNSLIIGEDDKTILNSIKNSINSDFNTLVQNYAVLKNYFNNKIINYQKRICGTPKKSNPLFDLCIDILCIIWGAIWIVIGMCGIFGVYAGYICLYDKEGYEIFSKMLRFSNATAPYAFLFIGFFVVVVIIYSNIKQIKQ